MVRQASADMVESLAGTAVSLVQLQAAKVQLTKLKTYAEGRISEHDTPENYVVLDAAELKPLFGALNTLGILPVKSLPADEATKYLQDLLIKDKKLDGKKLEFEMAGISLTRYGKMNLLTIDALDTYLEQMRTDVERANGLVGGTNNDQVLEGVDTFLKYGLVDDAKQAATQKPALDTKINAKITSYYQTVSKQIGIYSSPAYAQRVQKETEQELRRIEPFNVTDAFTSELAQLQGLAESRLPLPTVAPQQITNLNKLCTGLGIAPLIEGADSKGITAKIAEIRSKILRDAETLAENPKVGTAGRNEYSNLTRSLQMLLEGEGTRRAWIAQSPPPAALQNTRNVARYLSLLDKLRATYVQKANTAIAKATSAEEKKVLLAKQEITKANGLLQGLDKGYETLVFPGREKGDLASQKALIKLREAGGKFTDKYIQDHREIVMTEIKQWEKDIKTQFKTAMDEDGARVKAYTLVVSDVVGRIKTLDRGAKVDSANIKGALEDLKTKKILARTDNTLRAMQELTGEIIKSAEILKISEKKGGKAAETALKREITDKISSAIAADRQKETPLQALRTKVLEEINSKIEIIKSAPKEGTIRVTDVILSPTYTWLMANVKVNDTTTLTELETYLTKLAPNGELTVEFERKLEEERAAVTGEREAALKSQEFATLRPIIDASKVVYLDATGFDPEAGTIVFSTGTAQEKEMETYYMYVYEQMGDGTYLVLNPDERQRDEGKRYIGIVNPLTRKIEEVEYKNGKKKSNGNVLADIDPVGLGIVSMEKTNTKILFESEKPIFKLGIQLKTGSEAYGFGLKK
ncbi:MAG: hypothetical protein ABII22_05655 [Candidatus Micrarchaeota archaeon]